MKTARIALIPAFFVLFVDNFGFSLTFNLLGPLFLLPDYGLISPGDSILLRNILIAIAYGVFPFAQFFTSPLIGDLADHFGRKKAFYLTLIGMIIGFVLSGVSIYLHSAAFFILTRLITGVFAGNQGIALAAIADLSPTENARAKNFAIVTTLYGLGWILAMIVGGYISNPKFMGLSGPPVAFFITAVLTVINFFTVYLWFNETHKTSESFKLDIFEGLSHVVRALQLKEVRLLYFILLFWTVGWGITVQWFTPFAIQVYHATPFQTTSWFIVQGVLWTLGSSIGNQILLKYFRSLPIAAIGFIIIAIFVLVISGIPNFTVFAILYCIAAFFSAYTLSNTMNLISMAAPADVQGKVMGLSGSMMAFGWIMTSIVAIGVSAITILILFYVSGLFLAVGAACYIKRWYSLRHS